jgi:hypothetical protein
VPVGFFVPPRYGHAFRGRHYNRPTLGVWQLGGPCFIAVADPWWPFAGSASATPEALRQLTDEIMLRIEAALDEARAMAV